MKKDTYWSKFSKLKQNGLISDVETIEFFDLVKEHMKAKEAEKQRMDDIKKFLNRF